MPKKSRGITPRLLDLFERQRRGTGTYEMYSAWYQVRRSDPSSPGRSHLSIHGGRQLDLLSDLELVTFYCATQFADLLDVREHFPLSLNGARHELCAYDVSWSQGEHPGTLGIARELRRRHPVAEDEFACVPKPVVTSLLLTLGQSTGQKRLLAVSLQTRFSGQPTIAHRLQREYWEHRSVPWVLITRQEFDPLYFSTIQRVAAWALGQSVNPEALEAAAQVVLHNPSSTLTQTLHSLQQQLRCDSAAAQRALWQAIWKGYPAVDLRRGWRPHLPLSVLTHSDWRQLNPLLAGRSAWS